MENLQLFLISNQFKTYFQFLTSFPYEAEFVKTNDITIQWVVNTGDDVFVLEQTKQGQAGTFGGDPRDFKSQTSAIKKMNQR